MTFIERIDEFTFTIGKLYGEIFSAFA